MARWISPRRSDLMMPVTSTVTLGNEPLTIEQVVHIARSAPPGADYLGEPVRVEVSEAAWGRVRHTRGVIDALADDSVAHYGISTGFGALANTSIPPEKRTQLQRSLIPVSYTHLDVYKRQENVFDQKYSLLTEQLPAGSYVIEVQARKLFRYKLIVK